jgi:beta-glucosidase
LRYGDVGDLKPLAGDAGAARVATVDNRVFFAAGKAGAGWSWWADEGGVSVAPADKSAQEDARIIRWNGTGPGWVGLSSKTPIDLQREANGQLSLGLDYKIDAPVSNNIELRMDCGTHCQGVIPVAQALAAAPAGHWAHLKIPLACFGKAGTDMSRVTTAFAVRSSGHLALSVANIRLESGMDGVTACATP